MSVLVVVAAAALGACVGSFLGVLAWRVPRGESVVWPPSHCASCGTELRARDLVPLVSWLSLRGRCRYCHAEIPVSALLAELAGAFAFALLALVVVG